jgi:hypothetical protein
VAVYGPRLSASWLKSEYRIDLLGKDIPVDAAHPHKVAVKYPLYLRYSAFRAAVLKNGQPISVTWGLPTAENDIVFTVDDRDARYTLVVWHNDTLGKLSGLWQLARTKLFRR